MNPRTSSAYFLASLLLLVLLVSAHAITAARRTQAELRAQLSDKGLALAEAVEASSRHAIRSNALMEEMIAQRLLDNARLIDELLAFPGTGAAEVARLAEQNRLRRVDLVDLEGRPWTPPPPPHAMGMGRGGMWRGGPPPEGPGGPGAAERPMMHFQWGRRWGRRGEGRDGEDRAPVALKDRKFWEGTVFGVAVGARSFPGIIAVHADAEYLLHFRREMGVERQIEDVGRQAGVTAVALLDADLAVLAHSDPTREGSRRNDPELRRTLAERHPLGRLTREADGTAVYEVARPLALDGQRVGLLTIGLSTAPMERAWRRDLRSAVVQAAAVLGAGALGLAAIFYVQRRHLRERRVLETQVERSERLSALGDVAAAFAHEVRNPLNAVSMGLQRLGTEFAPDPAGEYARLVELMQGEVRRLNAIVERFLALARPLPVTPVPMDAGALLRALGALLEGEARRAGVTLRVDVPAALPAVVADRDHLQQVLLNLALNATEAMAGPGGTLALGAHATRDRVVLTVADSGPGIPAGVLPRIFDPYFTTKPAGLGLGLTIARRIVEAHGGALEVDSRPGQGTRFTLSLPRATA